MGDDLPEMIADRRALNRILLNLLSNAIRFSERGGTVVVGARAEAGTIIITVEDDGIGMSEEDLAQVGQPYFQARASYDRRRGGTGLGLSIVKGLVRLHGGQLSIRSRVGEGTRVTVRLPLDCERAGQARHSLAPEQEVTGRVVNGVVGAAARNAAVRLADSRSFAERAEAEPQAKALVKKSA